MIERRIDVYHTHIEIFPYKKGEFFDLEKVLSRWDQISKKFGKEMANKLFVTNAKFIIE